MGPQHSTPRVKGLVPYPIVSPPDFLPNPSLAESDPRQTLSYDLRLLLKDVERIPLPMDVKPICTLSPFSIPLLVSSIELEAEGDISLQFAKMAISRHVFGRVLCLGSISVLLDCVPERREFSFFLEKVLRWIGGPRPLTRMLCLYRVDERYHEALANNMIGLGFGIDVKSQIDNYLDYTIIVVQNDTGNDKNLISFVQQGGGLVVCGVDSQSCAINETMIPLGLSFLPLDFKFAGEDECQKLENDVQPQNDYTMLSRASFDSHVEKFKNTLCEKEDHPQIPEFAEIIIEEMLASTFLSHREVINLCEFCGNFLHNYYHQLNHQYGCDSMSRVITKLVVKALPYMPSIAFEQYDFSCYFVGFSQNAECSQINVFGSFSNPGWFNTGVWIQPGFVSMVTFDKRVPDCDIIIGAHSFDCSVNEGPWKRFPKISYSFHVTDRMMHVSTPYGGMVFLDPGDSELVEKQRSFKLTFSDACKCSQVSILAPELWKNKYDKEIPWSEFITKYVYLVIQTEHLNAIENYETQIKFIDSLVDQIIKLSSFEHTNRFCVVFDIEYPKKFTNDYPITLDYLNCSKIVRSLSSSPQLFHFCAAIAYTTMPDSISEDLHTALAVAIAHQVFSVTFSVADATKCNKINTKDISLLLQSITNNSAGLSQCIAGLRKITLNCDGDPNQTFFQLFNDTFNVDISSDFPQ